MCDRSKGIGILNRISDEDYEYVLYFLKTISSSVSQKDIQEEKIRQFDSACKIFDELTLNNPWNSEKDMIAEMADFRKQRTGE